MGMSSTFVVFPYFSPFMCCITRYFICGCLLIVLLLIIVFILYDAEFIANFLVEGVSRHFVLLVWSHWSFCF
jgi:hypothetical protein